MKSLKLGLAISIALATALSAANAQERVRKNERWCLESKEGRGGGGSLLCRYESYEQCMASKTSVGDTCMKNPALR